MTIGQVAERTGLSVHTLRFYEQEGLAAAPIARDHRGRRLYREQDVEWLTVCIVLRRSGMPVREIRRYMSLVQAGTGNEEERLGLLKRHQRRVEDQMNELQKSLDLITEKIGIYEEHLVRLRERSRDT